MIRLIGTASADEMESVRWTKVRHLVAQLPKPTLRSLWPGVLGATTEKMSPDFLAKGDLKTNLLGGVAMCHGI